MDQASYDIDTAKAMLDTKRLPYVLFMCQQAIEKALKALIIKKTNKLAPRIHNLGKLAESLDIDFSKEQLRFMMEVSTYYVRTRYPEELVLLGKETSPEMVNLVYLDSKEMVQWLSSKV